MQFFMRSIIQFAGQKIIHRTIFHPAQTKNRVYYGRMGKNGYEHVKGRLTSEQLGLRWISGITRWDTAKAVHTKPHKHPHMEVIFCLRGELSYRIDGLGSVTVCEGSGIVIPRYTTHVLGGGTDSPCERIGLHVDTTSNRHPRHSVFSPSDIRSFCQTLADKAGVPFRLDTNLQSSIRELAGFLKRTEPLSSAEQGFVRSLCCGMLYRVVSILRKPLIAPRTQMMDAAVEFINQHYGEEFRLDDLIHFMGYGRTRLFTLFKHHTGLTPNEYLVRLRIRKAKELAGRGQTDAAQVAKAVGFKDPAYFKTVYLRYTGVRFAAK